MTPARKVDVPFTELREQCFLLPCCYLVVKSGIWQRVCFIKMHVYASLPPTSPIELSGVLGSRSQSGQCWCHLQSVWLRWCEYQIGTLYIVCINSSLEVTTWTRIASVLIIIPLYLFNDNCTSKQVCNSNMSCLLTIRFRWDKNATRVNTSSAVPGCLPKCRPR